MKPLLLTALLSAASLAACIAAAEPQHEGQRGGGAGGGGGQPAHASGGGQRGPSEGRQETMGHGGPAPRMSPQRGSAERMRAPVASHAAPARVHHATPATQAAHTTHATTPARDARGRFTSSHAAAGSPAARSSASRSLGSVHQGGHFTYQGHSHATIRGGSYAYPSGYGYRRWGSGMFMPALFLSSMYYFDGYAEYGFGVPPYGCRWVRYGPDIVLVDLRSGRILNVVYGVFYY
jgi:Ni/Co efflux regulator RcnB